MERQEIKNKISLMFSDVMYIGIEGIDEKRTLLGQDEIDELDILDWLTVIDEEFGTNLWDDIDVYKASIEDIVTLIEQEINH